MYTKYLLKPIKKNNRIVKIPSEIIANENFKEIYEIILKQ